jgi:hypothetical protein
VLLLAALVAASGCLGGDDETRAPSGTATLTVAPGDGTNTPGETATGTETGTGTATSTASAPATGTPTETPTPTPTPTVIIVPTTDPGTLEMKVLNYANPIVPGQIAFITLIAEQGASCIATLKYSGEEAGPTRLQRKEISPVSQVDWTWKVQESEPQTIDVTATCMGNGKMGVREFTIVLEAPSE